MREIVAFDRSYRDWVKGLKDKVRAVQIKAAVRVNTELLTFYWELGREIVEKQQHAQWGDGFLKQLSADLSSEFPEMKGFSRRNLELVRRWYLFYHKGFTDSQDSAVPILLEDSPHGLSPIAKQVVSQLVQIPWGHNIAIVSKCGTLDEASFYVRKTIQNNWSRAVLTHHIESDLFNREGRAITNFEATLPAPLSDLARETLKDPYTFDFLTLTEKHNEKDLENGLTDHVTRFLLELGAGFSYIGRQFRLEVEGDEFFIDLLFYHVRLHCFVVAELKPVKFKPEFAGKLGFYISAVDAMLKSDVDNPTIGILICKSKNDTVVEYALRDLNKPIGVSEYILTKNLPDDLRPSLPSIEQIEAELNLGEP